MTKQEYTDSLNKFDVLNSLSPETKKSYLNADPRSYGLNIRLLGAAQNDVTTSKKAFMTQTHEAATTFEKDAHAASLQISKKSEKRVENSDEEAAENLIKNI